jgi:hypothetical protein
VVSLFFKDSNSKGVSYGVLFMILLLGIMISNIFDYDDNTDSSNVISFKSIGVGVDDNKGYAVYEKEEIKKPAISIKDDKPVSRCLSCLRRGQSSLVGEGGPSVYDLRPLENSSFNVSDVIEISANVTSSVGVDKVKANINLPNGSVASFGLTRVVGTDKYNRSYTIPALVGQYDVRIIANDTNGNINSSETTYFNVYDYSAPSVNIMSPSNNSNFTINSSVNILVNVTDNGAIDSVYALITKPNGTNVSLDLNFNGSFYNRTLIYEDLIQRGQYVLRIIANDTGGNVNSSEYLYFRRIDLGNDSTEIIGPDGNPLVYNETVLQNNSGILDLELNFTNYTVHNLKIYGFNESSPFNVIKIAKNTSDGLYFNTSYAVDLSGIDVNYANVTINATGTRLYKCIDWNFSASTCDGVYMMTDRILTPGQSYVFTLTPGDPGFGDASPDNGTPDFGEYYPAGDGYSSIRGTWLLMQNDDGFNYFAVERDNGVATSTGLEAYLNITYNITNITVGLGISEDKIYNLSFFLNYCLNSFTGLFFQCDGSTVNGLIGSDYIQIYNFDTGNFENIESGGKFTPVSSGNEENVTREVLASYPNVLLGRYVSAGGSVKVRYHPSVSFIVNDEDASFGVDYATLTVSYDLSLPNVTVLNPSNGSTFNLSDMVNVTVNATDNVSRISFVEINITYPNGTSETYNMTNVTDTVFSFNVTDTSQTGNYSVSIIAYDGVGNTQSSDIEFEVEEPLGTSQSSSSVSSTSWAGGSRGFCTYNWVCSEWEPSVCPEDGVQRRSCENIGSCLGSFGRPPDVRDCRLYLEFDLADVIPESGDLLASISLVNHKISERTVALFKYEIKNSRSEVVYFEEEHRLVEGSLNFDKLLDLDLEEGYYVLTISALINGEEVDYQRIFRVSGGEIARYAPRREILGSFISYLDSLSISKKTIEFMPPLIVILLMFLVMVYFIKYFAIINGVKK